MSTLTQTEKKALNELFFSLHVKKNLLQRLFLFAKEIFRKK
jgi:hypothetical protein